MSGGLGSPNHPGYWESRLYPDIERFRRAMVGSNLQLAASETPKQVSCIKRWVTWLGDKVFPDQQFFFNENITLRDIQELKAVNTQAPNVRQLRERMINSMRSYHKQKDKSKRNAEDETPEYRFVLHDVVTQDIKKLKIGNLALSLSNVLVVFLYLATFQTLGMESILIGLVNLGVAFLCLCLIMMGGHLHLKEQDIRIKQAAVLRLMVYDRLMVTDSQLLSMYDNNIIFRLLYKEADDMTGVLYLNWYKLAIFDVATILTLLQTQGAVWFAGAAYFVLFHIPILILTWCNLALLNRLKKVMINKRKLILEILNSYKAARFLGLGRICSERIRAVSQVQERIKLLFLRNRAVIEVLQKIYAVIVNILLIMFFWFENYPPTQKQYNNQMLPPTRLGFYFVWYLTNQALEQLVSQMEHISNQKSAQELFDKFFSTDVLVESNQVTESLDSPGILVIRDCEMYDRIPENFSEVVDFLLGQDNTKLREALTRRNDRKNTIVTSRTLVSKDESKNSKKGSILRRVAPKSVTALWHATERLNVGDTRILAFAESQGALTRQETKSPVRAKLRKIFGKLDLDILPGEKLCIIEDKNRDASSYLMRLIMGGGIMTRGDVERGGLCVYLNPHKPCFLAGRSIKHNIMFGRAYDRGRYERAVQQVGLNLHAYPGRDHHQIGEQADNLGSKDKVLVLLARLIYSDAAVCVVEDLFRDPDQLLLLPLLKSLFADPLKHKTVIFNSRQLAFVLCSTKLVKFGEGKQLQTMDTADFKTRYRRRYGKILDEEKYWSVHRGKQMQNYFFLANADFREELMIQKDVELNRALVTRVKQETPNLVEQIFGGVLLVQKVIQRGKVIMEEVGSTLPFWEICKMMFVDPVSRRGNLAMYSLISFCMSVSLYLHIFLNTFGVRLYNKDLPPNYFFGENAKVAGPFATNYMSEKDTHRVYLLVVVSAVVYVCLVVATTWYSKKIRSDKISMSASRAGAWFMGMSYRFLESNFFHSLVDRFSSDVSTLNFDILPKYIALVDLVMEYAAIALTLTLLLSVWSSIFIQGVMVLIFAKVVYPSRLGYLKLQNIKIGYQSKLDQLHYQLLNLISDYRLANQLGLMMAKIEGLQNSLRILDTADMLIYRKNTLRIMIWMVILQALMIFSVRFLVKSLPKAFYLSGTDVIFYMNLFMYLRQIYVLWQIITIFYDLQESVHLVSILHDFKTKMLLDHQKLESVRSSRFWRRREFEADEPLVFKHVSVTKGYRPVLKNVSFSLPRGSKTAIVGSDWIGRSAIFQVIMGAILPDPSRSDGVNKTVVKIFGVEQEFMSGQLYDQILHLDRHPHLLDGTARSNIDPYHRSQDVEILKIAERFGIEEILARLEPEEVMVLDPRERYEADSIKSQASLQIGHDQEPGSKLEAVSQIQLRLDKHVSAPTYNLAPDTKSPTRAKDPTTDRETQRILHEEESKVEFYAQKSIDAPSVAKSHSNFLGMTGQNNHDHLGDHAEGWLRANSNHPQLSSRKSSKEFEGLSISPLKLQILKTIEKQSPLNTNDGSVQNPSFGAPTSTWAKKPKKFSSARRIEGKIGEQSDPDKPAGVQRDKYKLMVGSHQALPAVDFPESLQNFSQEIKLPRPQNIPKPKNLHDIVSQPSVGDKQTPEMSLKANQISPLQEGHTKVELGGLYLVKIARLDSKDSDHPSISVQDASKQPTDTRDRMFRKKTRTKSVAMDDALNFSHLSSLFGNEVTEPDKSQDGGSHHEDSDSDGPP